MNELDEWWSMIISCYVKTWYLQEKRHFLHKSLLPDVWMALNHAVWSGYSMIGMRPITYIPPAWKCLRNMTHGDVFSSCTIADTDECESSPCKNGATCLDGVDEFTCSCAAGFGGTVCDTGRWWATVWVSQMPVEKMNVSLKKATWR